MLLFPLFGCSLLVEFFFLCLGLGKIVPAFSFAKLLLTTECKNKSSEKLGKKKKKF